jgi:hypothetical protein
MSYVWRNSCLSSSTPHFFFRWPSCRHCFCFSTAWLWFEALGFGLSGLSEVHFGVADYRVVWWSCEQSGEAARRRWLRESHDEYLRWWSVMTWDESWLDLKWKSPQQSQVSTTWGRQHRILHRELDSRSTDLVNPSPPGYIKGHRMSSRGPRFLRLSSSHQAMQTTKN